MKNLKNKGAFIICIVAIILIIVLLIVKGGKKEPVQNNDNNNSVTNSAVNDSTQTPEENNVVEEFVQKNEDGSKENISEELKKTKTVAGLELTNIRLVESNGLTQLVADAKNTTNSTISELDIIVTAVDKDGKTLAEFEASVYGLASGKTTKLSAGITDDIANAYDFTVRKK